MRYPIWVIVLLAMLLRHGVGGVPVRWHHVVISTRIVVMTISRPFYMEP